MKKLLTMVVATVMAISAMGMTAFAAVNEDEVSNNSDIVIDYSDLVYVQEDADAVAEYNAMVKSGQITAINYTEWSWSKGIFSITTPNASGVEYPYYFVPTANYLYFNLEFNEPEDGPADRDYQPWMRISILEDDGTLSYVGNYYPTKTGDYTYSLKNYKRPLNAGTKYVVSLWAHTNWKSVSLDIYNKPF